MVLRCPIVTGMDNDNPNSCGGGAQAARFGEAPIHVPAQGSHRQALGARASHARPVQGDMSVSQYDQFGD
tara:strand:- start:377 stop:586 length:210 start_codon:yes stop_codon:yes gene_type:complete